MGHWQGCYIQAWPWPPHRMHYIGVPTSGFEKGGQAFIPGRGAVSQVNRAKKEGPGAFLFYYPQPKKYKLPTVKSVRAGMMKQSGVPKRLTIQQMLNPKP